MVTTRKRKLHNSIAVPELLAARAKRASHFKIRTGSGTALLAAIEFLAGNAQSREVGTAMHVAAAGGALALAVGARAEMKKVGAATMLVHNELVKLFKQNAPVADLIQAYRWAYIDKNGQLVGTNHPVPFLHRKLLDNKKIRAGIMWTVEKGRYVYNKP